MKRLTFSLEEARIQIQNFEEKLRIADEELGRLRDTQNDSRKMALPLAYAYNMVKSELSPAMQMERLRRAIGIVLRFYASIVLADYKALGFQNDNLNQRCKDILATPVTDGSWLKIIEEVARYYSTEKVQPHLIKELTYLWVKNSGKTTDYFGKWLGLIKLRNEIHDNVSVDESTAREWLKKAMPRWEDLFATSGGINGYEMLFLEALEDFSGDRIVYLVKWIMGEHLIPRSERVFWEQRLNKCMLYLRDKKSGICLDLSPFMAYEYSEITRTRETYCIEQIIQGRILFSTIRFPHKIELPNQLFPFQTT